MWHRIGDASKCTNWADLVVPIGGDGTFLLASKLIMDSTKPVLGINPNESIHDNIFTLPSKYAADIPSIFQRLHTGEYSLLMRSRIRTVMNGEGLYRRPFHIHEKSRTQGEKRSEWVHYRKVILSDLSLFYPVRNQYVHFYSLPRGRGGRREISFLEILLPSLSSRRLLSFTRCTLISCRSYTYVYTRSLRHEYNRCKTFASPLSLLFYRAIFFPSSASSYRFKFPDHRFIYRRMDEGSDEHDVWNF